MKESGDGLLVLGYPAAVIDDSVNAAGRIPPGFLAGFVFSQTAGAIPVPLPPAAPAFIEPRSVTVGREDFRVVWYAPLPDPADLTAWDSSEVWVGRFTRGAWSEVARLGIIQTPTYPTRQIASDLVRFGDDLLMAIADLATPRRKASIALVRFHDGAWALERLDVGFNFPGAVALAEDHGDLFLTVTGGTETFARAGAWSGWAPLTASRFSAGKWTQARVIAGPLADAIVQPKLVHIGDDLYAAWIERGTRSTLSWRKVSGDSLIGRTYQRPGVKELTAGEAPFQDVLTATLEDGSNVLLRLTPATADALMTIPAVPVAVPVVAGSRERPFAVSLVEGASKDQVALVAYDLRCTLHR